jgi:hypothetical protein
MSPQLIGIIGFVLGIAVSAIVGFILKRKKPDQLDAFLDLDWDRDGESGEIYAKLKKTSGELAEKIKTTIKK